MNFLNQLRGDPRAQGHHHAATDAVNAHGHGEFRHENSFVPKPTDVVADAHQMTLQAAAAAAASAANSVPGAIGGPQQGVVTPIPKRRGRPKGSKDKNPLTPLGEKKKRGRPKGRKDNPRGPDAPRRGRPPKDNTQDSTPKKKRSSATGAPAKKRGRKPKAGVVTSEQDTNGAVTTDADAAHAAQALPLPQDVQAQFAAAQSNGQFAYPHYNFPNWDAFAQANWSQNAQQGQAPQTGQPSHEILMLAANATRDPTHEAYAETTAPEPAPSPNPRSRAGRKGNSTSQKQTQQQAEEEEAHRQAEEVHRQAEEVTRQAQAAASSFGFSLDDLSSLPADARERVRQIVDSHKDGATELQNLLPHTTGNGQQR